MTSMPTQHHIFIEGRALGCHSPDWPTPLFEDIDIVLGPGLHFLVGRNGCGKSILARMLAGVRAPDHGRVLRFGSVAYLPQALPCALGSGASLLGVDGVLQAHRRVLAGEASEHDYDLLEGRWNLPHEIEALLDQGQLPLRLLSQPAEELSGGERTRLALLALTFAGHDFLVLDEPTNHLDQAGRAWFSRWIGGLPGALVVSHDRELLPLGRTIHELDGLGLHTHEGGWDDYLRSREQLRRGAERREQASQARLDQARRAQAAAARSMADKRRHASSQRAETNQSKMILDKGKETSDQTLSRQTRLHAGREARAHAELSEARTLLEQLAPLTFQIAAPVAAFGHVLALHEIRLPHGTDAPISLTLRAGERIALCGPNGCGKSTLLKVIGGQLAPLGGELAVTPHRALLDQHNALLDPERSALHNFMRLAPGWTEDGYRTVLAQMRLRGELALRPVAALSGGEQIKVALAALLCGPSAPALLLVDEPDNHLDLDSKALLEAALARYRGAMVLVSHDPAFIRNAGVDNVLELGAP